MCTSLKLLQHHTEQFFDKHWSEKISDKHPEWSKAWELEGSMPNHDKQGVYVFIEDDEITYIGSGAGRGKGGYERHGLGARIAHYIRLNEKGDGYIVRQNGKLSDRAHIRTIGFESGYGYLAVSLEQYLISKLKTKGNVVKAGS